MLFCTTSTLEFQCHIPQHSCLWEDSVEIPGWLSIDQALSSQGSLACSLPCSSLNWRSKQNSCANTFPQQIYPITASSSQSQLTGSVPANWLRQQNWSRKRQGGMQHYSDFSHCCPPQRWCDSCYWTRTELSTCSSSAAFGKTPIHGMHVSALCSYYYLQVKCPQGNRTVELTAHLSPTLSRTHVATRPNGIEMRRYTIESQLTISREMWKYAAVLSATGANVSHSCRAERKDG